MKRDLEEGRKQKAERRNLPPVLQGVEHLGRDLGSSDSAAEDAPSIDLQHRNVRNCNCDHAGDTSSLLVAQVKKIAKGGNKKRRNSLSS